VFATVSFDGAGHPTTGENDIAFYHRQNMLRLIQEIRRLLTDAPADFGFDCQLQGLPVVSVVWQAVFPTVGFAQLHFGGRYGETAAVALLLGRLHPASDEAAISSAEEMLGGEGGKLAGAFRTVRQHKGPVLASFALAGADTPQKLAAIQLANAALGEAFFTHHLGIVEIAPAPHVAAAS
jgi:hypothetical protein